MTNSNIKSNLDLNDLVHLNSCFITKKISDSQFIQLILLLNYKLSNRGSYQLLDIYVEEKNCSSFY